MTKTKIEGFTIKIEKDDEVYFMSFLGDSCTYKEVRVSKKDLVYPNAAPTIIYKVMSKDIDVIINSFALQKDEILIAAHIELKRIFKGGN